MYYVLYKDAGGYWRWRLRAANNKTIADSGEGYFNRSDALSGIALVKQSSNAPVREASGAF
ncbi:YegP family protein [Celeribacter baekdonensis]|uniref:DUF1508 domain-containing protein n=1 Tax=Celeribacter baekdonensis TaxID=875171 RepID=A0A2R4M600_9RHOB|nr:DUF1508 domain-containing protein [Celeribacter baekdonensis]AVW92519.1 DUF1508 domain-containing protein [Celeribacter baekdonensis]